MREAETRRRAPSRCRAAWTGVLCTLLLCIPTGCGGEDAPPQGGEAPDAPPRIVASEGAPATLQCGDATFRLSMATRLPPARVPGPIDVDLGADGSLYVLDRESRQVKRFAPDGAPVGALDPSLHGFYLSRGPLGLAVSGRGEVYLWDPHQQAMLAYPANGAEPYTFTVLGQSYGLPARVEASDSGRVAAFVLNAAGDRMEETARVFTDRGEPVESVGPFPVTTSIAVERDGMRSTVTLPLDLSVRTVLSLTPSGGFVVGDSRDYRLAGVQGRDTLWRAARAVPAVRPTSADIRNALALAPSGIGKRAMRRLLPEAKSAIVEMVSSHDWLLVRRPIPSAYTSPALYDLYRSGSPTPCATVEMPPRVLAVRGGLLAGINYEDPERPVVEVYALTRGGER